MGSIPSIDEKINRYVNNNPSLKKIRNTPLWKSYNESKPEVESYAKKIISAKSNPVGDSGILVYGQLSGDSPQIKLPNKDGVEETFDLVSDPYEYYFTDLVFIQQKYEEALIDLYLLKAEEYFLSTSGYPERLQKIEKAIQDTLWIAEKNLVKISKEEILAKFTKELDKRVAIIERELNVLVGKFFPITPKYSLKIAQATKEYYLDPNNNTYNKLKDYFFSFLDTIKKEPAAYMNGTKINDIMDVEIIISVARDKSGLYIPLFSDK